MIEDLKKLAWIVKSEEEKRERLMAQLKADGLVKHYLWCEREVERIEFLKTQRERSLYLKSLFSSVLWGLGKSSKTYEMVII